MKIKKKKIFAVTLGIFKTWSPFVPDNEKKEKKNL